MPTYHTQPSPTWRDRFTERELRLIKNARTYAENDPAGLPNHDLLLIIARLSEALDTLPLHEVSPDVEELLRDFFEQKWLEGKLTEMWTDEDMQGVVAVLSPYLGGRLQYTLTPPHIALWALLNSGSRLSYSRSSKVPRSMFTRNLLRMS